MVLETFLNIIFALIITLINAIPRVSLDTVNEFGGLISVFNAVNTFMPLTALKVAFSVWLSLNIFDFGYQCIMWIIRKIPGIS